MAVTPRGARMIGSGDIGRMFPDEAPMAPVPWERAGQRKDRETYDKTRVKAVLLHHDRHEMVEMDPAELHATQPSLTRAGVRHYLTNDYRRLGTTYGDQGNPGNRRPIVYAREDGTNLLLSGHHRAASALLQGHQFAAVRISGPWGASKAGRTG